jgi:hypothetical protein
LFKLFHGQKSEKIINEALSAVDITTSGKVVRKVQMFYGNGYTLGATGMCGLKFFDKDNVLFASIGSNFEYPSKVTMLEEDERIVGVVGLICPSHPNFY